MTLLAVLFRRNFLRFASVLIGVIVGTIFAFFSGQTNFHGLASAGWFGLPHLLPFGFHFNVGAVGLFIVAYLIAITESIGNYVLVGEVMGGQSLSANRINRGILAESIGSAFSSLIGGTATTSYAQNIGVIGITGIGCRRMITVTGIALLLFGLSPKVGAVVVSIPPAVVGGALILAWGMLIAQGIRVLASMRPTNLNMLIIGISFVVGMGSYFLPATFTNGLPTTAKVIVQSGLVIGTMIAMLLYGIFSMWLRIDQRATPDSTHAGAPDPETVTG